MINLVEVERDTVSEITSILAYFLRHNPRSAEIVCIRAPNALNAWHLHRLIQSNLHSLELLQDMDAVCVLEASDVTLMNNLTWSMLSNAPGPVQCQVCVLEWEHYVGAKLPLIQRWPRRASWFYDRLAPEGGAVKSATQPFLH